MPTTKPVAVIDFSLDAARVSKLHNPGNLKGLVSVKPGTAVELMMYYTLKRVPHQTTRVTVYEVDHSGKVVFKVAYRGTEKSNAAGRFSRFALYTLPASLPFGSYIYRATLTVGDRTQSEGWKFVIGAQNRDSHS